MKASDFNRFTVNPVSIDIPRARFERPSQLKTSFNAGDLVPIYVDEVLPGDTFSMDTAVVARMTTPIHPVMDNCNMDIFYFFVPNRLVWNHWEEFMGQATPQAYIEPIEYNIPKLKFVTGVEKGSVADQMGIPIGIENLEVNALPFRAYALIWNEFFRDQNTMNEVLIPLDDSDVTVDIQYGNSISDSLYFDDYVSHGSHGDFPLRVAKYHDYFTSSLPQAQKGKPVQIGLVGEYPLIALDQLNDLGGYMKLDYPADEVHYDTYYSLNLADGNSDLPGIEPNNVFPHYHPSGGQSVGSGITKTNLGVDISSTNLFSINLLRQAFQLQKLLERDARGGTRYTEIIKAHFGVTSPDSRLQRPEYLGGKRIPITMQQVLQTSSTNEVSPQGNTAAYSLTSDRDSSFTKSFTEHGYIIGLACVRAEHTYQQGIERMWNRNSRYDFYDPVFANIGEQPILNKEIFAQGTDEDDEAFGFQEAWAEYRYKPSRCSGALRSTYAMSLDVWHYGDNFAELPTLSPQFITETKKNIDRTLAVSSTVEDQFICDFYFKNVCVRPMPLYSIPGLIDHH